MGDKVNLNQNIDVGQLRDLVDKQGGTVDAGVSDKGVEIYASPNADAKPSAKSIKALFKKPADQSAVSEKAQALAKSALYEALANTYTDDIAAEVFSAMTETSLFKSGGLTTDLIDQALVKANSLVREKPELMEGLNKKLQQKDAKESVLSVPQPPPAALKKTDKKDGGKKEFELQPPPKPQPPMASIKMGNKDNEQPTVELQHPPQPPMAFVAKKDDDDNPVFGLKGADDNKPTEQKETPQGFNQSIDDIIKEDDENDGGDLNADHIHDDDAFIEYDGTPPDYDNYDQDMVENDKQEDIDDLEAELEEMQDDDETDDLDDLDNTMSAVSLNDPFADKKGARLASGAGVNIADNKDMSNLKNRLAKSQSHVDNMNDIYDDIQQKMQDAQNKRKQARADIMQKRRTRSNSIDVTTGLSNVNKKYADNIKRMQAQRYIEKMNDGGNVKGIPDRGVLYKMSGKPSGQNFAEKEIDKVITKAFQAYDGGDLATLDDALKTSRIVVPALKEHFGVND